VDERGILGSVWRLFAVRFAPHRTRLGRGREPGAPDPHSCYACRMVIPTRSATPSRSASNNGDAASGLDPRCPLLTSTLLLLARTIRLWGVSGKESAWTKSAAIRRWFKTEVGATANIFGPHLHLHAECHGHNRHRPRGSTRRQESQATPSRLCAQDYRKAGSGKGVCKLGESHRSPEQHG
jgi:hypothetical protein